MKKNYTFYFVIDKLIIIIKQLKKLPFFIGAFIAMHIFRGKELYILNLSNRFLCNLRIQ